MEDLDSLVKNALYLKSLGDQERLPTKVDKKLLLPDSSCSHAVKMRFKETNELVFNRIFRRPLGRRCFAGFLETPRQRQLDPIPDLLTKFMTQVEGLTDPANAKRASVDDSSTAAPGGKGSKGRAKRKSHVGAPPKDDAVLTDVNGIYGAFLIHAAIKEHDTLWKSAGMMDTYHSAFAELEKRAQAGTGLSTAMIKGLFVPYVAEAKEYLAGTPFEQFLASDAFVHYAQWKQLELNMKVVARDFDIHRILGRGGFGEVYGCRKRDTGAMFAMKQLDKKRLKLKKQERTATDERNVLAELNSKFVTNLKYAFQDENTLYLIMDLMDGGDLGFQLREAKDGHFTEEQARFYACEISLGLAHIHSRQMIYRDMKPENILLDTAGHCRISDMGLVRDCTKSWPTSECGTHGYMAPEVLTDDHSYGMAADWFSLGCTIYEFLVGVTPFYGAPKRGDRPSSKDIDKRTLAGKVAYPPMVSEQARGCLEALLHPDPKQRLGAVDDGTSNPVAVQAHPWFSGMDWEALADHRVEPAIVPSQGQVNAEDILDIHTFNHRDVRKVKVTDEDVRKYYRNFDHIMSHQWQEEVLPMFDMIVSASEKVNAKRRRSIDRSAKEPAESGNDSSMQGYMLSKGTGLFKSGWSQRYVHVFADRIEIRTEQRQPAKHVVKFSEVEFSVEEDEGAKGDHVLVLSSPDAKPIKLKAFYRSDSKLWTKTINKVYSKQTGKVLAMSLSPTRRTQSPSSERTGPTVTAQVNGS